MGGAGVLTGALLAAGFGVCALSDFAPTARFGGLCAFAIVTAVSGDLFLLPALLGSTPRAVVEHLAGPIVRRPRPGPRNSERLARGFSYAPGTPSRPPLP